MKDYDYIGIDRERNALERGMSSLLSQVFKRRRGADRALVNEVLEMVNEMISKLQAAMASPNKDKLLDGEFNKDSIFLGSEMNKDRTSIPLYFELDILIAALEKDYVKKFENPQPIISMLQALGALRDQAATLAFNSAFKPDEPISEAAMDDILATQGDFEVGRYEKNGMKFIGIAPTLVTEQVYYSNGEYLSGGRSSTSLGKKPLYEKDAQALREIQNQNLAKLHSAIGKYFEHDWDFVPTSAKFFDKLIDIDLDERLKKRLLAISYIKDKHPDNYEVAAIAAPIVEEIIEIEHQIQKEQEAALTRQTAINEARARYQEKSGFWKFFHRQMSPDKLNLDAMSTEEIDGLYKGKAR